MSHPECVPRAEVTEDIQNHVKMVHNLPLKHQQLAVQQYEAETNRLRVVPQNSLDDESLADETTPSTQRRDRHKLEAIPRPKISTNATQSDWSFFVSKWTRYVSGSKMSDEQQINQLLAACSDDLQLSLHCGNSANITNPAILMENIRLIAVKKLNNLVNIVNFQQMAQFNDETVTAFVTRLNGPANLCDLNTKCESCSLDISFKKKMIMYQMYVDLRTQELKSESSKLQLRRKGAS